MAIPKPPRQISAGKWIWRPLLARCPASRPRAAWSPSPFAFATRTGLITAGAKATTNEIMWPAKSSLSRLSSYGREDHGAEPTPRYRLPPWRPTPLLTSSSRPSTASPAPIAEWVTTFQLAAVVLDPFTNESSWILDTAGRVLLHFREADCRVAFIVTGTADEARQFLGPWADKVLTFADPDRAAVKGMGLNELPAFVQVRGDLHLAAVGRGLGPRAVAPGRRLAGQEHELVRPAHPGHRRPVALRRLRRRRVTFRAPTRLVG